MGKKETVIPRVVIDTNVIVSAMLFRGTPFRLVSLWKEGKMRVLLSRDILDEYVRTLSYPKFRLSRKMIKAIVEEELLPYVEVVNVTSRLSLIPDDPDDDKFLECAVDGRAEVIISGDSHLLKLGRHKGIAIVTPHVFLAALP